MRRRHEKGKHAHYCLLVNRTARNYDQRCVRRLIEQIRRKGGYYTVFEPDSADSMTHMAQRICGLRKWHGSPPQHLVRRGRVTSLIACGGDGTVNLVGRVALKADLPLGILPMGSLNNIARSLYESVDCDTVARKAIGRNYRKIDVAIAGGRVFFGSAGIGLAPNMVELLSSRRPPRFCLGWSQLGSRAAASVQPRKMVLKIDAFRFEVTPMILNVNLLPYSFGLPLSPVSVSDDGMVEVICNFGVDNEPFSGFVRQVCRRKYVYGSSVRLFRGREVGLEPVGGLMLYYDGELVEAREKAMNVSIGTTQLKVFC